MSDTLIVNARFLTQRTTGVQRYAYEVTSRLPRSPNAPRVELFAPRAAGPSPLDRAPRTRVRRVGRLRGHGWEQLDLPRFARTVNGASLWSPCTVGPLAVADQVVTIHDVFALRHPEWVGRAFHRWYSMLLPPLARRCRHIVTVSEYSKGTIVEALDVDPTKVTVVPEGVAEAFAPPPLEVRERVRQRYGLPERFVLALGSLEPRKNLPRLIEAWSRLPERDRPSLIIAGGIGAPQVFGRFDLGPYLRDDSIRYLGYVPDEDLPAMYALASVFAYPSLEEGFGLPPLEAIACETQVITSANSAMAENCTGLARLVDPCDVDAIAHALYEALDRPSTPTERAAFRTTVRTRFDWQGTADRVAAILTQQ